jgi:hypothetical protein
MTKKELMRRKAAYQRFADWELANGNRNSFEERLRMAGDIYDFAVKQGARPAHRSYEGIIKMHNHLKGIPRSFNE